jgi:hypothetical protein
MLNVRDRNAGFATGQAQVWGFDTRTGIDSRSYFAPGAKIFYVDPNNAQAVDAGNLGEDPTVPLATVDAAVTLSRAYRGDTIVIGPNDDWQYAAGLRPIAITESLIIPATKGGIRIVGAGTNPLSVNWEAAVALDFCITVHACDVLIEGIGFTGNNAVACSGIYSEWDGATLFGENLTVRGCSFDDAIDTAIQLEFSWYCQIYNNWFSECDVYGVHVDVAGSGVAYCDIHNNYFTEIGTSAIALLGGCDNNHVHHNHIYNSNAQGAAAATNEGIDTTGGRENLVHHNTLSCLLPVPANGDYNDFCTGAATDSWNQNYCINGPSVANPT